MFDRKTPLIDELPQHMYTLFSTCSLISMKCFFNRFTSACLQSIPFVNYLVHIALNHVKDSPEFCKILELVS